MASYGFSYLQPDTMSVTPERFLELRLKFPDIKVLKIIPPTSDKNDLGRILVCSYNIEKEEFPNVEPAYQY